MEKKPTDKFINIQFHLAEYSVSFIILYREMNFPAFNLINATVTYGTAKNIARKIFQNFLRMGKRLLYVDNPCFFVQRPQ